MMYIIKYVKQKNIKNITMFFFTLLMSALTGICIFPYSIKHIFFSYRGQEVTSNLLNFSNITYKIRENIAIINDEIFHGDGFIIIALMSVLCVIWVIVNKKKCNIKHEKNSYIKYVMVPTIIYLAIITIASPYEDLRYLMPVIPFIFLGLVYVAKDLLQDIVDSKYAFFIILLVTCCFSITTIPSLSNNTYTNIGSKKTLSYVEDNLESKPMICVYDELSAQNNKIMEMYEVLTKVDKTFILSTEDISISKIKNALSQVDTSEGFSLILNKNYAETILNGMYNTGIITSFKYCGALGYSGRYQIYELK